MVRCRIWVRTVVILTALVAATGASGRASTDSDLVAAKLRSKILAAQSANRLVCRGELVCGIAELPRFYAMRGYRPAWIAGAGELTAAQDLIRAIEAAGDDGLRPSDYHLDSLRALLSKRQAASEETADPELVVDLDFLLTDAFLLLGSHLLAGRVNPETLHAEWGVALDGAVDLAQRLQRGLESGEVRAVLSDLRQPHPGYAALAEALKRYRDIEGQGGWRPLPEKAAWSRGQAGETAELLRERLEASGDLLATGSAGPATGDEALSSALRRFQARHGLEASGRLDPPTLPALNVPVPERIRQIELNLERWRWIPRVLGDRHIWVNVTDFNLEVFEAGHSVMGMRVVVGRHYRRTPVFSGLMEYLVFNPDWNIPTRIAVEDILPKIRKDPAYMGREKIRVYENWSNTAAEIDPADVDWSKVTPQNFRFKLKKEPGPQNDLGRVKFMFPNKYSVYLHDTLSRKLFERGMRGFSSGCIRIEKPLELAEYVLRDAPGWTRDSIAATMNGGERRSVGLPKKIPVHLVYLTAWVDARGTLQFRPDIYQRDPVLDQALRQTAPG